MVNVIGIHPSVNNTSVAINHHGEITIHDLTIAKCSDELFSKHQRALFVGSWITQLCEDIGEPFDITMISAFSPYPYASAYERSGIWWHIVNTMINTGTPIVGVSPAARAMYITGNGKANKNDINRTVQENYAGICAIGNKFQASALTLAAIGSRHLGDPIEYDLPESHLKAIDKIVF